MIEIVRFRPEHLQQINLQEAQAAIAQEMIRPEYAQLLMNSGPAFSAIDEHGNVIASSGVSIVWENRAIAWALISKDAGKHFKAIHRAVKGFLDASPIVRIEAFVDVKFDRGVRWLGMLGFENETPDKPMRKYTPTGSDCYLFARVK